MGKSRLTYDGIATISVEVKCIINSWPLTYVDNALTPSQLVWGCNLYKCFIYEQIANLSTECENITNSKLYDKLPI